MPWIIYGAQAGGYDRKTRQDLHGPFPHKRWVYAGTERFKKNKLHYHWSPGHPTGATWNDTQYNEDRAEKYARWIAARDGIKIEGRVRRFDWSGFYSQHKKRNVKHYGGVREQEAYQKRVRAVEWGHEDEIYAARKDGRRGVFLYKQFVAETRIEIPHWDFEHSPIEACEQSA